MGSSTPTQTDGLSWCETIAANGCEHLRRLSDQGLKTSGGCDTLTLCGLRAGWDLPSPVTPHSLARTRDPNHYSWPCPTCVGKLGGHHG